ncbi:cation diffusion facilitator family transporter [Aquisphaera insulae]|uniref:cation diffusion facilitator family transporter n=1 Tax=Aquisphaera insulae TaxID=2712864 RepID=UPI00196B17BE|nr:cation diffusion facilitator family transporter [Aquisphaera insulae]
MSHQSPTGNDLASRGAETKRALYHEAVNATWLGFTVNVALGVAKLVGGLIAHSFALISDAVNSLGDVFTSLVVLLAFRVAQKPADAEHPYGHTRAEAIAGSNVAVLVLVSALLVGWEALTSEHDSPLPPLWTLFIAGTNVAVKELLYQYKIRVGRRTGSSAVIANAWDHRADALSALAVFLSLAAIRLGGAGFLIVDKLAALFVVFVIVNTAAKLLWSSAQELMDAQADPGFVEEIRDSAAEVDGVRRVDKLWVRKSGLEFLVDIHIQVDATRTVDDGHRISHVVKDRLLARFGNVRDVLVHLEPYPHAHEA